MFDFTGNSKLTKLFFALSLFAFFVSVIIAIKNDTGTKNLYIFQAQAFQRGQLDIPVERGDVAQLNGKYYVPFPPFPAVLLLPFTTTFTAVNTTLVAFILTIFNVIVARDLLKRLHVNGLALPLLLLAFFLGTGYWLAVIRSSGVWYFAHIVCVTFTLLSIREALANARGWLAGFFLGFAVLSRQLSIYTSIFILAALFTNQRQNPRIAKVLNIAGFLVALGACILVYLAFNEARFGSPFDTGYSYLKLGRLLSSRVERFGLFSVAYVPLNLIYMFFQGPHFEFQGSLIPQVMDPFGTSLTFASPFIFAAVFARGDRLLKVGAWLAIGFSLVHMLLYYNNGLVQVNTQRFTLDFLPVLFVLIALALPSIQEHRSLFNWSVIYAVMLNIVALLLFPYIRDLLTTLRNLL